MYLQRGIACIYYGEELGMRSQTLGTVADFEDPQIVDFGKRYGEEKAGVMARYCVKLVKLIKMAARLPLPFDTTVCAGFSKFAALKCSLKKKCCQYR